MEVGDFTPPNNISHHLILIPVQVMQQFDWWRTTKIDEAPQEVEIIQAEGAKIVKLSPIVPEVTSEALDSIVKPPPATLVAWPVGTESEQKYEGIHASSNQRNPKRMHFTASIPDGKLKVCITLALTLVMYRGTILCAVNEF